MLVSLWLYWTQQPLGGAGRTLNLQLSSRWSPGRCDADTLIKDAQLELCVDAMVTGCRSVRVSCDSDVGLSAASDESSWNAYIMFSIECVCFLARGPAALCWIYDDSAILHSTDGVCVWQWGKQQIVSPCVFEDIFSIFSDICLLCKNRVDETLWAFFI